MRRLLLVLSLAAPMSAQFATYDAANWGINSRHLQQTIKDATRALHYYQMAQNAAAFVHNPAAFLSQVSLIGSMAVNDAAASGWTTRKTANQLQARLQMGRIMINESGAIGSLSHANATNAQGIAMMMQSTAEQLARLNAQMQHEQRSKYYMDRNRYEDQGSLIAGWRLK